MQAPKPVEPAGSAMSITVGDEDLVDVRGPHHDSLVISIQISWATVSRVLIDGDNAVNIMMLGALKALGIDEDKVVKKATSLVGFSGESKKSLGEISLLIYVDATTSSEKFCVLDCQSPYNVILGRPWIHNMRAVPSTLHQCVKILSKYGVTSFRVDQGISQECYGVRLKPPR